MNGPAQIHHREKRWPVVISILFVLFMLVALPQRIRILPAWVLYTVVFIEIVPLVAAHFAAEGSRWVKIEKIVTLAFCIIAGIGNIVNLGNIIDLMLNGSREVSGLELLVSGIGVWSGNMLSFSLLFWLIDRGGPDARAHNLPRRPDWLFPQESAPASDYPPGWKPDYVDYLFLGFCTATAFSPTDALPLTHRAKLLIILESSISLLTILVVLSRAVNILQVVPH